MNDWRNALILGLLVLAILLAIALVFGAEALRLLGGAR